MNVDMDKVEYVTETALTIRGSRRRTTVPKEIVVKLKLKDGDRVRWLLFKNGDIFVSKVK
jgi:bifunctional DNA-binding transcriptional regulator/antitoxin component of YhaV-PrlF toxin-antitoxin module